MSDYLQDKEEDDYFENNDIDMHPDPFDIDVNNLHHIWQHVVYFRYLAGYEVGTRYKFTRKVEMSKRNEGKSLATNTLMALKREGAALMRKIEDIEGEPFDQVDSEMEHRFWKAYSDNNLHDLKKINRELTDLLEDKKPRTSK